MRRNEENMRRIEFMPLFTINTTNHVVLHYIILYYIILHKRVDTCYNQLYGNLQAIREWPEDDMRSYQQRQKQNGE